MRGFLIVKLGLTSDRRIEFTNSQGKRPAFCSAASNNLNIYFKDFVRSLADIRSRTKLPILCGGSGLYVQTALEGNELSSVPVNNNLRQQLNKLGKKELQDHFDLFHHL